MQFLSKPQKDFFIDVDKIILKCVWKGKGPRIANSVLKKKSKVGGINLPNFKTYYITTAIKTMWYS